MKYYLKKINYKKYLSILLVMVMMFTSISYTAIAGVNAIGSESWSYPEVVPDGKFSGGDGKSSETAFQIATAQDLANLAYLVNNGTSYANNYFVLTKDIDLKNFEWTPIGLYQSDEKAFCGIFDGAKHTISGLKITQNYKTGTGLFGDLFEATISNLNVDGDIKVTSEMTGAIAGIALACEMNNCTVSGSVIGTRWTGGLVGRAIVDFVNCTNNANITGNFQTGGIAGQFISAGVNYYSTANKCVNNGTITGTGTSANCYFGGITGQIFAPELGKISNCLNNGAIEAPNNTSVGGIIGQNFGYVYNCLNLGSVTGAQDVGGVIGENCYSVSDSYTVFGLAKAAIGSVYKDSIKAEAYMIDEATKSTGELTYKLNGNQSKINWYQTLGSDNAPLLDSTHKKVLYIDGKYTNTCNHEDKDNDGICDICGEYMDGVGAKLVGYSLSLSGNIGVNFYMELAQDVIDDANAHMLFTLPNRSTKEVKVADVTPKDENGKTYYVFSCEVAAKEMTSAIKAQMICNNDKKGTEYTYTVKDYADYIINHSADYALALPLVKAMLNYGAYAQTYFNYQLENLANASLTEADKTLGDVDLSQYGYTKTGTEDGISYYGSSLVLESETTIRHYFELAGEKTIDQYTFKLEDGTELKPVQKGNYYYVDIENISAANLDKDYVLSVGGISLTYSAMCYVKNTMASENKVELVNVVKALYFYNMKANEYFK